MQGPEDLRIDLAELKLHIVKKIGAERCTRYFYYLGRFLSHKVTKSEFDKSCHRLLGKENLPLHNRLIHSILRNASLAKSRPPEGSVPNHYRNDHVWSNGVVGVRDRPSPLGPNGKVESLLHQPHCRDDRSMEKGGPCRYADEGGGALLDKGKVTAPVSREEEAQEEERGRLPLATTHVVAPLGIRVRRRVPVSTKADFISCYDSGGFSDTEMLRKRMESIAVAQGLGGVSPECSSIMLSNVLDVYLKKLIKSCVDLSGARSTNGNQSNSLRNQPSDTTQEQHLVSLLDFRAAMELNPSQLGPLLRERLLMRSFEERGV